MWALIKEGKVIDLTDQEPSGRYHPSLVWVDCSEDVKVGWGYENEEFSSPPLTQEIPTTLTRAQARAALIISGNYAGVQTAINAIPDPLQRALAQNDWDNRLHFDRDNPTLLSLASAIGLSSSELDDLFVLGNTL